MGTSEEFRLTGWHVFAGFVAAFTLIIGVNLALAFNAVRTFPGVETRNSYVASQSFDERRAAQQALGWRVSARSTGGEVLLSITDPQGTPVEVIRLDAVLGRATHVKDDRAPDFVFDGQVYRAQAVLAEGNWNLRMTATAQDGTPFTQRVVLQVED